jgi:hypothetical protein
VGRTALSHGTRARPAQGQLAPAQPEGVSTTVAELELEDALPTQQNVGFAIDWFHSRATVSAIHRAVPIGG